MVWKRLSATVLSSLWFVPLLYAVVGVIINVVTITLDRTSDHQLISIDLIGGPDAALAILGTVAASMIGLVATVLAITMVVVQLAMAQFSPRIVQTFLQDKPSQNAIGLFVMTFVQSMLSMREVQVSEDDPVVPGLSVVVTFGLVIVDIVVLVIYIHHIGRALRVSALIELVGTSTRSLTDEIYPDAFKGEPHEADPHIILSKKSGVLSMIGHEQVVEAAVDADVVITLIPALGQFVPAGAPLARVEGATAAEVDESKVRQALALTLERTLDQDVAFGVRMLVDMGLRAMAEHPLADPTTTVQVIDRVHDVLRQLARRDLPEGTRCDDAGQVRLVVPSMDWSAYVLLAFEELRLAGAESPQVSRRLRSSLLDLLQAVPPERKQPLQDQLRLLEERVVKLTDDEHDLRVALQPDPLGIGVEAGERKA